MPQLTLHAYACYKIHPSLSILPHPTFLSLPTIASLLALTLSRNMMQAMFTWLSRKKLDEKVVVEQPKVPKAVYRDAITKKKSPSPSKAVKKSVRFVDSEPTILGEERSCNGKLGEKAGIRVKVRMTKEEAARLLSKCKEGGVLEFKDVASELVALPVTRVSVVSTCTNNEPLLKVVLK